MQKTELELQIQEAISKSIGTFENDLVRSLSVMAAKNVMAIILSIECYTEQELNEMVEKITHPVKREWYETAIELLVHTYGIPHETLSKVFVDGFIDGYVHAKSLSPTERQTAEALLKEYNDFVERKAKFVIPENTLTDFITSKYGKG